ncbi:hypothetical protein FLK61_24515 [Paenalkalicoccus suaedae]|uniref:Tubby C-terminal domain-containing protein n=1 Tax=Paenalkalicoccus suaedae TaxID=2592382 RepID=A0A859FAI5_9BACI|nr:hypothetical protein [Paenalkalicoccus suaedae]QKS69947.1 hypothetical protein FLK61_24515 [Paenalkalicoccus suaedae]
MIFEFTAPTVAKSDKPFDVHENGEYIGSISRFFTNPQTRTPHYDVNLHIHDAEDNHYRIIQNSFTMLKGGEWEVKKGEQTIGSIRNSDNLFQAHEIEIDIEGCPTFSIKGTFSRKGKILNSEREEVGETYRTTYVKRTYEGEINDSFLGESMPILFYGIIHFFWCGFPGDAKHSSKKS